MLPVVLLGADATVRAAFEAWNDGTVLDYRDAMTAQYELADRLGREGELADGPDIAQGEDGRWRCSVVYGPLAYTTAFSNEATLAHTGWTVCADSNITDDQFVPRRVRHGELDRDEPDTLVWEAATRVGAHLVVDVAQPASMTELGRLLAKRDEP